jgi:hypothetical protein
MTEEVQKEKKPKLPQVSASIPQEVYDSIKELADRERRSISSMTAILLEKGFKDKTRKR